MKTIFSVIIICTQLYNSNIYSQDSLMYSKIIDYVSNTEYLSKAFKQYHDSLNVCVSVQRIYLNYEYFIDEIIDFEYPFLDNKKKDILKSDLRYKYNTDSISNPLQFAIQPDSVHKGENCNLMMYLSDVDSNKIYVEVTLWKEEELDWKYTLIPRSPVGLHFLFYMSDNDINKVFQTITSK